MRIILNMKTIQFFTGKLVTVLKTNKKKKPAMISPSMTAFS